MKREVEARAQVLTGTVLSRMKIVDDDGLGSATYVVDVFVGKLRVFRDVAVKASSGGSRSYAALGQSVQLARNTQGRFDVIGPGDHVRAVAVLKKYVLGNTTPVSTRNVGFTSQIVPFEFYKGTGTSLWNDGVTPFPLVRILDGDLNPV